MTCLKTNLAKYEVFFRPPIKKYLQFLSYCKELKLLNFQNNAGLHFYSAWNSAYFGISMNFLQFKNQ